MDEAIGDLPDKVCLGGQKNFQSFMQRLKDEPPPPPDQAWFKRLIAIAILYRSVEKKIKSMKFPAYGAQITGYVVSGLSHRAGGRIDFNGLWSKQMISPELEQLIAEWALRLDEIMRKSAGPRNPSEWFKKADCWKEIHAHLPALTDPLPPELSYVKSDGKGDGKVTVLPPTGRHTIADYERIERCMQIPSAVWMEIAERGQKTGAIHWKVAGICRTLAGYAAGGWEKKPSARQAKPALEAVLAAEQAGLVNAGISAQIAEGDQG